MKDLLKYIPALGLALACGACESDLETVTYSPENSQAAVLNNVDAAYVLDAQKSDQTVFTLKWSEPDMGYQAAVTNNVEIDLAGNDFATPVVAASLGKGGEYAFTHNDLNNLLMGLLEDRGMEIAANDFEIRIASSISASAQTLYSNTISTNITPFVGERQYPKLWIVGEYCGWNDVRIGTVRALERRGFTAEAIRNYWLEAGIKSVDVQFSWDGLYGKNREIIDPVSNRYFFVEDQVGFDISGVDAIDGKAPLHPDHPERGNRTYHLEGDKRVYLSKADADTFTEAGKIRLKDLCNISYGQPAAYDGDDVSVLKHGVRAVQWVGGDGVKAELLMPDGSVRNGLVERSILDEDNRTVQLERVGFAVVEKKDADKVTLVYAHR